MDLKQWQCSKGHALGVIRMNGNGIPQLMLYRHAVDLSAEQPAQVDVGGNHVLDVGDDELVRQ